MTAPIATVHRINTVVVSRAQSRNLTTLERVKIALDMTDDTTKDSFFRMSIPQCSARADRYCHRFFAMQTYEDSFRAEHANAWWGSDLHVSAGLHPRSERHRIVLRHMPIRRIVSFTEGEILLAPGRDYEFNAEAGLVYRLCGTTAVPWSPSLTASIQYDAGYKIPDEFEEADAESLLYDAPDVEKAVRQLVIADFYARNRDMMMRERSGAGAVTEAWWAGGVQLATISGRSLPTEAADLLSPFIIRGWQ